MDKFLNELFGSIDASIFVAWYLLAILGALVVQVIRAKSKYKKVKRTPEHFSLSFFIRDNMASLVTAMLTIFIFLRFSNEALGIEASPWIAFVIGVGSNELSSRILKFSLAARKE